MNLTDKAIEQAARQIPAIQRGVVLPRFVLRRMAKMALLRANTKGPRYIRRNRDRSTLNRKGNERVRDKYTELANTRGMPRSRERRAANRARWMAAAAKREAEARRLDHTVKASEPPRGKLPIRFEKIESGEYLVWTASIEIGTTGRVGRRWWAKTSGGADAGEHDSRAAAARELYIRWWASKTR